MTELDRLRRLAGFSMQDMATWLDAPAGAVRTWCLGERAPAAHKHLQIKMAVDALLQALESDALPVPLSVKLQDRPAYVRRLRGLVATK